MQTTSTYESPVTKEEAAASALDQEWAIMSKLEGAMSLLADHAVSNLLLKEGSVIEFETTMKGEVSIASLEDYEVAADSSGVNPMNSANVLTRDEMKALFRLVDTTWQDRIRLGGIDGPILMGPTARFRANIFLWGGAQNDVSDGLPGRLGCIIRVIPEHAPELSTLGLPGPITVLSDANYGLLLVVGPTGSGKTTTMASYFDHLNATRVGHMVTIEDPIEYVFSQKKCRITPKEVGTNVSTIAIGVRDAMREIPLAIMIGEVRDTETLVETFRAARSGHYVVTTKHAPNLVSAIRSLVDDLPGDSSSNAIMISETLLGVIFQVRVPSVNFGEWVFVHETMDITNNPLAQELIASKKWTELRNYLENPTPQEGRTSAGVVSLNRNLAKQVREGHITAAAADRRAYDRVGLRILLK